MTANFLSIGCVRDLLSVYTPILTSSGEIRYKIAAHNAVENF